MARKTKHEKNLTPAEELKKAEESQDIKNPEFDPIKNPKAISIIQQEDGNFKLFGQRNGKMYEIRAGKPEDCLAEYLTMG